MIEYLKLLKIITGLKNFSYALRPEKQAPVANYVSSINATGQLLFATKIIREDLIPKVIYKGKEYKVIDFTKMDKNTDLSKYGFEPGVTYDTARFFLHAGDIRDFYIAVNLSNIVNDGFLSTSCVSPGDCKTFCDMPFAVSFDCEKQNIASAFYIDQYSGYKKNFSLFSKIITGEDKKFVQYRQTVPDLIKAGLNLDDNEYIELFNMFKSKKYLSQISDNKMYKVGKKVLSGEKIKKAIVDAENKLSSSLLYNEINLYNPKINAFATKVNSLDEIPEDFLNFAHEYNLPIYIFGD